MIEVSLFFYYSKEFLRLKVEMKYHIKCELVSAAVIWISMRVFLLIAESLSVCFCTYPVDFITNVPEIMVCLLFINLIAIPLLVNSKYTQERHPPSNALTHSFPEALHFWAPNHYFGEYLKQVHPELANYCPLMADILRYDFQLKKLFRLFLPLTK